MENKEFDWDYCASIHSPAMVEFLRSVQNEAMTESEFVARFVEVPRESPKKGMRSPSMARAKYRNLASKFGFFAPARQLSQGEVSDE